MTRFNLNENGIMCVKDCGLHSQKYCFSNFLHVSLEKNYVRTLKSSLGWREYWHSHASARPLGVRLVGPQSLAICEEVNRVC